MIFTIGHSTHPIEVFIALLHRHGITAVGDVRSHPYSRYVPQYSREPLKAALIRVGIEYIFLGRELGARSENPACYKQGKVQYDCLAKQPQFAEGIRRISEGMQRYRIALMCAEKDPLECHRALLVARTLHEAGLKVTHIHGNGSLEGHGTLESRLLSLFKLPEGDMFKQRDEFVSEAYEIQSERVAYEDLSMKQDERASAS